MEVRRRFNRLLGSFRRKPHQTPTGISARETFQSKDKQTASRWELLNFGEEESRTAQENEASLLAKAAQEHQLKNLQDSLNSTNSGASSSEESALPQVTVELTRQNSNRLSQGISRSFRKLRSLKTPIISQSASYSEPLSSCPPEIMESLPYLTTTTTNGNSNITSVVHEINQTINLINEFKPIITDHSCASPSQLQPDQKCGSQSKPALNQFPVKFEDAEDFLGGNTITIDGMSVPNAHNPDLVLRSSEEVSRLTMSTQNWTDSALRKNEIINQSENERMRTKSLFSPDDPFCRTKLCGTSSAGNGESSTGAKTSHTTKDTTPGSRSEPSNFSSYSSRPWADEMEMPPGTTSSASTTLSRSSKPNILRRSGRKLYKKIHSRLSKKGEGETETVVTGDDEERFGWEEGAALCTASYATTSTTTFHERNKEKEIKSIHRSKSHSIEDEANAARVGNRLGLKRTRSSRLSHSFRKVISFPRRSSFTLLDGKNDNNDNKERNDTDRKMNQNSVGEEDYSRVLSLSPKNNVTPAQKSSEGETAAAASAIRSRRSLSLRVPL